MNFGVWLSIHGVQRISFIWFAVYCEVPHDSGLIIRPLYLAYFTTCALYVHYDTSTDLKVQPGC